MGEEKSRDAMKNKKKKKDQPRKDSQEKTNFSLDSLS